MKSLDCRHIAEQIASRIGTQAGWVLSRTIMMFYFFENKRREKWNKPPGMRRRPEERAGSDVTEWKVPGNSSLLEKCSWGVVLGSCPRLQVYVGFCRKRKLILWFCVKRWLVSEDKNPSLEEFPLHRVSLEGNPESYLA